MYDNRGPYFLARVPDCHTLYDNRGPYFLARVPDCHTMYDNRGPYFLARVPDCHTMYDNRGPYFLARVPDCHTFQDKYDSPAPGPFCGPDPTPAPSLLLNQLMCLLLHLLLGQSLDLLLEPALGKRKPKARSEDDKSTCSTAANRRSCRGRRQLARRALNIRGSAPNI